jgi:hypothetical protein
MNHEPGCFTYRLGKGMKVWDSRNPEPNENLSESEWIAWYKKRAAMVHTGIKKLCNEFGLEYSENYTWLVPCNCNKKEGC